jgi:hypothetical protein
MSVELTMQSRPYWSMMDLPAVSRENSEAKIDTDATFAPTV